MVELAKAIGLMIAAMHGTPAAQSGPLTLDQAIQIAERNAFAVRLQESVIEKARQQVNQARGSLGPQISVGGNYTRFDQEIAVGFGTSSVVLQPIQEGSANATLTLPIDISGNRTRLLKANEASKKSADIALNSTYNDTRLSVRQAYLAVLRAKAQIEVDQKALDDAKGRLDQGQKQFDQAQVARLDVTRYKAQVAQSNADLLQAQDNLTLANYAFNQALARPIETEVSLVDVTDMPVAVTPEEDLVAAAQKLRPEIQSAQQRLRALALITRATEQGMNPSLSFQLEYLRQIDPSSFTAFPETTTGTLMLTVPIFDSGVTRAQVKQARQDEAQAKITLEQTKLQISQDVRSALANLSSAKARLENAQAQLKLAEEVFRLARVKQDAGAGTYYEVIDAESQLTLARNGVVSARYDYLISYSQLQRAVGSDDVDGAVAKSKESPRRSR